MARWTVASTAVTFGYVSSRAVERLEKAGCKVRLNPYGRPLSTQEMVEFAGKADAIVLGNDILSAKCIRKLKKLKLIARYGVGFDGVDLHEALMNNIQVTAAPASNREETADFTMGLILNLARHISVMSNNLKAGVWEKRAGISLYGKTIGIIGVGAIGSRMARACHDLGMQVIGYDPYLGHARLSELKQYVRFVQDVNDLYSAADIVSVHIPLNDANRGFVSRAAIDAMKDGVYLINYARGPVLDNEAVCDAIDSGKIRGFATDFPTARELGYPQALCTPHLGAGTPEADENCSVMAARQICEYLENGNISNSVNFPDVSFARAEGDRIAIMHYNRVGMLGRVTELVAAAGLNIENLVNKARGEVAYTLLDFNDAVPADVVSQLSDLDNVIRVRVIPVGIIYFFLYYFAFSFLIKKFNFKTPGREEDDEETKLYTKADVNARKAGENGADELSSTIARALGSKRNITSVDCCATRLRCSVADSSLVDQKLLKATGASGVIVKGTGVQVIYGPKVAVIKSNLEEYLVTAPEVEAGAEAPVVEEPAVQEEAPVAVHGDHEFYAPVAGTAHAITEAPDAAFAGKMMGDGFFIAPADGTVVAPCDAEVMFVFDTKHAIGMKAADGTEFLIHFGVDTVKLGGQGFETFVEQGQQVKKGDKLMQVDLDYVKANAPSDVCLVIFTGGQAVHVEKSYGIKALDAVATY